MSDSQQRGAAIAMLAPILRGMTADEAASFFQQIISTANALGADMRCVLVLSSDVVACVSNVPKPQAAMILRATADQIEGVPLATGTAH